MLRYTKVFIPILAAIINADQWGSSFPEHRTSFREHRTQFPAKNTLFRQVGSSFPEHRTPSKNIGSNFRQKTPQASERARLFHPKKSYNIGWFEGYCIPINQFSQ